MKQLLNVKQLLLSFAIIAFGKVGFSQDAAEVVNTVAEKSRPMYERMGMSSNQLFVLMMTVTILLVAITVGMALNLSKVVKFKMNKDLNKGIKVIALILALGVSGNTFAAEAYEPMSMEIPFSDEAFWGLVVFDICLVFMILYLSRMMNLFMSEYAPAKKFKLWARFQKQLTDAKPIEEEGSILLDHDYDGIKELDNNLPPWWKYGFYITIAWAFVYFIYYNVPGGGPTQEQELEANIEKGLIEVAEYKAAHPELVTEESAVFLDDAATINEGRNIFVQNCQTCHMDGGRGGAGPNLTDDYWIYGPSMQEMFHTIYNGANNGMRAWKNDLNGLQIQAVASYINQLDPILPPEGQEPKGDYFPPEE
ncbi:c-type cytochrome [Paracrocinitomix mangrovi]|uniref:cbb3-type cytochrome c oxidase N-terminal domain-containing protein n=1 Tax=Paracrocinitomix mangrovi TaxID=2862509 RepID=UPI001C8CFC7D|nr:cbb3-type cytochrome c oxidase N-terminal domain-containing protein [Paracrocinitomix mangrovi]UKN01489.1 c-type cytochrome [Paracrocinitomix mangrovi]